MGSTGDIYSQLKELLKDTNAEVVLPTDGEKYEKAIVRWSEHCIKRASAVVFVTNAADIAATLSQIRTHNLPFTVKGGGHSTSGAASIEEGLVIDLSKMRKVSVDPTTKTITAEGGTLWEDVDVEAAKYGLATVGGTVNHTGVAGLTLGGGYGYLSGKYGLTIDNLLSVEIVLASGQIVTVSSNENSDLFWAVRGAGQNFGVTTSFTFQGYPQPDPVFAGPLIFPPTKIPQIVAFANKFHEKNDGNQALIIGFSSPPPANAPVVLTQVFHNGSEEEGKAFFKDLFDLEPLANMTGMVPYEKLNTLLNHAAGFDGRKQFSGGAVKLPLNPAFVEALHADFLQFVNSHERMNESLMMLELVPFQKICETSNESMSFANRGEYYNIATMLKWFDPSLDTEVRTFARTLLKRASESTGVAPDGKKGVGLYGNYATSDTTASEVYGENVKKLEELKHKYDPDNPFSYGTRLAPKVVAIAN